MHKCVKCGREFEGNFCPDCGERFLESKTCPECGSPCEGGASFCPQCGYSFTEEKGVKGGAIREGSEINEKLFKTTHKALSFIPPIAFAVFALLLFAFFAAPVVVSPSMEIMGEKIPSESFGNLYAAYAGKIVEVPLKGCAVAALLFAVLSLPFALLYCCCLFPAVGRRKIDLLFCKVDLVRIFNAIGVILYLVFLIIGSVAAGIISSTDGGLGLIKSGACPVLIIVFSAILSVVSVASMLADRYLIVKNCSAVAEIRHAEPIEYSAPYPQKPQAVQKVARSEAPAANDAAVKHYLHLKYIQIITIFLPLAEAAISLVDQTFLFLVVFGYLLLVLIAALVVCVIKIKPTMTKLKFGFAKIFWLDLVLWIGCGALFAQFYMEQDYAFKYFFDDGFWATIMILASIALLLFLSRIILWIYELKAARACRRLFYGTARKKKCVQLNEYGADFAARQETYLKQTAEYTQYKRQIRAYKLAVRKYNFEKNLSDDGYDCTQPVARAGCFIYTHRLLSALIICAFIVGLTLAIVLPAALAGEEAALDGLISAFSAAIK